MDVVSEQLRTQLLDTVRVWVADRYGAPSFDRETIMIALNERYITDADGKRVGVILDIATFEQLVELLEDAEDEAWAADYARRTAAGELTPDELETVPLAQAIAELESQWAAEETTE